MSQSRYDSCANWYHWKGGECKARVLDLYKFGGDSEGSIFVISALPHKLVFDDESEIPPGNPVFCEFVKASFSERDRDEDVFVRAIHEKKDEVPKEKKAVCFVYRTHHFDYHVLRNLEFFMSQFPKEKRIVILTSIIGVQAAHRRNTNANLPMFIAPITTQETCRLPNDQKRCHSDKFLC